LTGGLPSEANLTNFLVIPIVPQQSLASPRVLFRFHRARTKSRLRLRVRRRHSVRKLSRCYDGADAAPTASNRRKSSCAVARASGRLCKLLPETSNKG